MPQVIYLIASHKNPAQVARLARSITSMSPQAQVLIHHDPSGPCLDVQSFDSDRIYIFDAPITVGWGEFSVVESELRCINWLQQNSIRFDWLVLLSGQDYPVQHVATFEHYLKDTSYDGFIEYFPYNKPPKTLWNWGADLGLERYYYRYYRAPARLKWIFRKLYRVVNWQSAVRLKGGKFGAKVAVRHRRTIFSNSFRCYAGSQWHSLNRRCVEYIQHFIQNHPEVVEYYRYTMVPDECFFQTILANNPDLKLCNDNLRYIAWEPPYPAIMQTQDFDRLIGSDKFFARKFDITVDADILDRLDHHMESLSQQSASK